MQNGLGKWGRRETWEGACCWFQFLKRSLPYEGCVWCWFLFVKYHFQVLFCLWSLEVCWGMLCLASTGVSVWSTCLPLKHFEEFICEVSQASEFLGKRFLSTHFMLIYVFKYILPFGNTCDGVSICSWFSTVKFETCFFYLKKFAHFMEDTGCSLLMLFLICQNCSSKILQAEVGVPSLVFNLCFLHLIAQTWRQINYSNFLEWALSTILIHWLSYNLSLLPILGTICYCLASQARS